MYFTILLSPYSNDSYRLPYFFQNYVKNMIGVSKHEKEHGRSVINRLLDRSLIAFASSSKTHL